MAATPEPPVPNAPGLPGGPTEPVLPSFPGREEDVLFKVQMGIAHAFYGYWKHGVGVIVFGLAVVFVVGTWKNHVRDSQREVHAEVSKISRTLSAGLEKHAEDPAMIKAQSIEGAKRLEAVAAAGEGPAAAYAWIKAAQAWKLAEDPARELACWQAASKLDLKGALASSVALGLAGAMVDAGDIDGAVGVLKAEAARGEGYEAQRALLEVGRTYELAGRPAEGILALEEFEKRFPDSALKDEAAASLGRMRGQG